MSPTVSALLCGCSTASRSFIHADEGMQHARLREVKSKM